MKNRQIWMLVNATLQGMLLCNHSVHICGISQNRVSTESNAQDGRLVKRENRILPTTQMKSACLGMKSPHQSLPNPLPHGIWRDPQKILEPLLSQEIRIAPVGLRVR